MKKLILLAVIISATSCTKKELVDTLVINANIYTVNENFDQAEAFAIKDGKIVDVGTTLEMESKYAATFINDVKGKTVVPGFIDAHCHFFGLGLVTQSGNLK